MRVVTRFGTLFLMLGVLLAPMAWAQSATVSGTITDANDGLPLSGANVFLVSGGSIATGAAADIDGRYNITSVAAGSYTLRVRYLGYQEHEEEISVQGGQNLTVNVTLTQEGFELNSVVVTASRQAEKVLDAPAAISVLDAREIETQVTSSSAQILRNTTGVDMAQTGVDRYEIVLRGFNNAFSGGTYVLTDYRQGAIASLGVNAYNMMPISPLDLDRIEVVRGPGSALYGPGVDAGVVHFISKDPFAHQGTTLSVAGGERSTFQASLRHAGVVNDNLGYKIVGSYSRAEDWNFDPTDGLDAIQLGTFRAEKLPVDYDNYKYNINGTLQYNFSPGVSLTANGGYSSAKSIFLSGIGTLQADGFGYTYGQLRLQAGSFFAQAYVNRNEAGDSFVYRTGAIDDIKDNSLLFNAQTQYEFGLASDRARVIVGADLELTRPDSKGTINGRNEDSDNINEAGAYAQSTIALHEKLDLTAALRADYNNITEDVRLSPRAALVFKVADGHSLRATYNRAFSSPGINSLFLDIQAGAASGLTIQARGAADGYNFQRTGSGELLASLLNPALFGTNVPQSQVGIPLADVYAGMYAGIAAIPTASLTAILQAQGLPVNDAAVAGLVALLSPAGGTTVQGLTTGPAALGFLNLTTFQVDRFATDVTNIQPLKPTTTQTFEVGYKGVIQNRVLLAVDAYYTRKDNFVGPLLNETPFVIGPTQDAVIADLQTALTTGITNNATLAATLTGLGLTPGNVSQLLISLAEADVRAALPGDSSPLAIVQPAENAVPGQLMLSYRNFGEVDFWGVDLTTQVLVNENLSIFGNASIVSDNFFDAEELGEDEDSNAEVSLNAPKLKFKAGFDYKLPMGLSFNASGRYVDEFDVRSGPYEDTVESYFLLDVGAGYDLNEYIQGLRFDVTVMNVLDDVHREFIGAPQLGRMGMARLTFSF